MDTFCTNCGEPWDTYHLRHDEIDETGLPKEIKESFKGTSSDLTEEVRVAFRAAGWEFGSNVLVIKRCPGCPKEPTETQRAEAANNLNRIEAVAEIFGDDLDGLESELEELGHES